MLKYCFIRKKYGITFSVCLHYGFLRCRSGDYQMKWRGFFNVIENNAMMSKTAMSVLSKMGSRIPHVEGF